MFANINYLPEEKNYEKSTKIAVLILAIFSVLMLLAIVLVIVLEVTKNNITTPKNFENCAIIIVDNGYDRVGVMTQLVKQYFKFDFQLFIISTVYGTITRDKIETGSILLNFDVDSNIDVFLHLIRDGLDAEVTHWIFLGDYVIPQKNVYIGDFFIDNLIKFINLVQVDQVLFSLQIPDSAPTMAVSNHALRFIKDITDFKLYIGTSTDYIYSPTLNQIYLLIDNEDLNDWNVQIKNTSSEKFVSYFILSTTKNQQLNQYINKLMIQLYQN
jgi:hypothetical protein